jgi:hypothetical protein|tara:strand:+ start:329 stop:505 length:177 start_codon:yes stop_codon:yes gene_type:complete
MARSWNQEEKLTVKDINKIMDIVLKEKMGHMRTKQIDLEIILVKLGGMAYWLEKNGEL